MSVTVEKALKKEQERLQKEEARLKNNPNGEQATPAKKGFNWKKGLIIGGGILGVYVIYRLITKKKKAISTNGYSGDL